MAHHESNIKEIGAGPLAAELMLDEEASPHRADFVCNDTNIAFGRLVHLMRRNNRYSIEKLAEEARIDIEELIEIEEDTHYRPDIRTVHQLANVFGLPRSNLLKVAGLIEAKNDSLYEGAIKFAARSEPNAELTPQEKAALEEFVAVINKV